MTFQFWLPGYIGLRVVRHLERLPTDLSMKRSAALRQSRDLSRLDLRLSMDLLHAHAMLQR